MSKKIKNTFFLFILLLLTLYCTSKVRAECGSYYPSAADFCDNAESPPGDCMKAEGNIHICPFTSCTQNAATCCSSQDECDTVFSPEPTPIPTIGGPTAAPPTPVVCPNSTDCGVRMTDAVAGNVCVSSAGYYPDDCISPFVICSYDPFQCCQSTSDCDVEPTEPPDPGAGDAWVPGECVSDFTSSPGIETALGCLSTDPRYFIQDWQVILIGAGGGIALLMMIIGSLTVLASQGVPEKIKQGKEIFLGGVTGLLIMIFAGFILRFIAHDVLHIW